MSTRYGGWSGKGENTGIDYSVYGEPDFAYYREPSNPSNTMDKAEIKSGNSKSYSDFTIEFSAKFNSIPVGLYGRMFECNREYIILAGGLYSGVGMFEFCLGRTWIFAGSEASSWEIPFGTVSSIQIVRDGETLKIYQNNELKYMGSVSTTTMQIADSIMLNHGSVASREFDSNVYAFRIYDKALTDFERTAHYEADKKYFGVN